MEQKREFDYSIALVRIVSCIMIFLCHYVQILGNPIIAQTAQFFNVGVFVFFMISGYLLGLHFLRRPRMVKIAGDDG